MSLSPIFSIIKDFLVAGSEPEGPKLRDMCKDVGATFLLTPTDEFLVFGKE